MPNLYKYIQIINENEQGTTYEKAIFESLIFFQNNINNIIDINNKLEKLEEKIIIDKHLTLEQIYKKIEEIFKDNELETTDIEKVYKENNNNNKDKIKKLISIIENKKENLISAFGKQKENEIYLKFSENLKNFNLSEIKKINIFKITLQLIARLNTEKNININQIKLNDLVKISNISISSIGSQNKSITDEWKKITKEVLNVINNEYKSDNTNTLSKVRNESTTKPKTDIIYGNNKLSLKLKDESQLATPGIVDIYTLIYYATNNCIDKNSASIGKMISEEQLEILNDSNFDNDNESLISNKIKQIKNLFNLQNIKTKTYVTIVYLFMLMELIISKVNGDDINEYINKLIIKTLFKNKNETLLSDFVIDKINDLEKYLKDKNEIIEILNKHFPDKEISYDLPVLTNKIKQDPYIVFEIFKEKEFNDFHTIDNFYGELEKFIYAEDNDYNYKKLITIVNNNPKISLDNIKSFIYLLSCLSSFKLFVKIKSTIKNIYLKTPLFQDEEFKLKEYEKVLISKKQQKKAENIISIPEDKGEKYYSKTMMVLNKPKFLKEIKKEIIKEAITGNIKFGETSDAAANSILEFDINNGNIKLIDSKEIFNYINDVADNASFDFSFKGGSKQSYLVLRLKIKVKKINDSFKNYIDNNQIIYNEIAVFDNIMNNIYSIFDSAKIKIIKILNSSKIKVFKFLNFLGFKIKVKKARMPKWIVDKL